MSIPFFIVITGPTAVGKTAFVNELVTKVNFSIEVINADMGQFYEPLIVGTAKPDLSTVTVPHHMFDVLLHPVDFTATEFRTRVLTLMKEITTRKAVPLLVGGSGFYIASLFYPPSEDQVAQKSMQETFKEKTTDELWKVLHEVDPTRACKIHKHDRYRITRALEIWHTIGKQPSVCEPLFDAPGTCVLYFLNRDREELFERINERTRYMLEHGWFDEVRGLSAEWRTFLKAKKLIGYPEIIQYMQSEALGLLADNGYELLCDTITQKTRAYAKRQITFWKHLVKRITFSDPTGKDIIKCQEINLSGDQDHFFESERAWLEAQVARYFRI